MTNTWVLFNFIVTKHKVKLCQIHWDVVLVHGPVLDRALAAVAVFVFLVLFPRGM